MNELTELTIETLNAKLEQGNREKPAMDNDDVCFGALSREYYEVNQAMQERDPERVYEELLDVATVALRRAQVLQVELYDDEEKEEITQRIRAGMAILRAHMPEGEENQITDNFRFAQSVVQGWSPEQRRCNSIGFPKQGDDS